jgi:hypothetical protein
MALKVFGFFVFQMLMIIGAITDCKICTYGRQSNMIHSFFGGRTKTSFVRAPDQRIIDSSGVNTLSLTVSRFGRFETFGNVDTVNYDYYVPSWCSQRAMCTRLSNNRKSCFNSKIKCIKLCEKTHTAWRKHVIIVTCIILLLRGTQNMSKKWK